MWSINTDFLRDYFGREAAQNQGVEKLTSKPPAKGALAISKWLVPNEAV
jgi:hypothetical protein